MDYTFYAPTTEGEFDLLMKERSSAIAPSDGVGLDQASTTVIQLDDNGTDDLEEADFIVTTREWMPDRSAPKQKVHIFTLDEVASLSEALPNSRMRRLPLFKKANRLGYDAGPPYTSLHYNQDIVIATPQVVQVLDDVQKQSGLDFQSMVLDLEATYNRDAEEVSQGLFGGMEGLKRESR